MSDEPEPSALAVVDVRRLPREALAEALDTVPGLVVRPAASVALLDATPDVLVVSAHGPEVDLLGEVEAARALGVRRVVALGSFVDRSLLDRLRAAGADAVLATTCSLEELVASVQGGAGPSVGDAVDAAEAAARSRAAALGITARQLEVLRGLAAGRTPQQLARDLHIAVSTCRDHIKALRTVLDCRTATEVVVVAGQRGLLPELGRPGRR